MLPGASGTEMQMKAEVFPGFGNMEVIGDLGKSSFRGNMGLDLIS